MLATELGKALPIQKENLPAVCRSTVMEHISENLIRVTFYLFVESECTSIECEYRRQISTISIFLNGWLLKQFSCEEP